MIQHLPRSEVHRKLGCNTSNGPSLFESRTSGEMLCPLPSGEYVHRSCGVGGDVCRDSNGSETPQGKRVQLYKKTRKVPRTPGPTAARKKKNCAQTQWVAQISRNCETVVQIFGPDECHSTVINTMHGTLLGTLMSRQCLLFHCLGKPQLARSQLHSTCRFVIQISR